MNKKNLVELIKDKADRNQLACKVLNNKEKKGYYKNTDLIIEEIRLSVKQRKKITLKPDDSIVGIVAREGDQEPIIILPFADFVGMLLEVKNKK